MQLEFLAEQIVNQYDRSDTSNTGYKGVHRDVYDNYLASFYNRRKKRIYRIGKFEYLHDAVKARHQFKLEFERGLINDVIEMEFGKYDGITMDIDMVKLAMNAANGNK